MLNFPRIMLMMEYVVLLIGGAQIIENVAAQVAPKAHYLQRFDSTDSIFSQYFYLCNFLRILK